MTSERTAFHVAPPGLSIGAVIEPGSWGAQVMQAEPGRYPKDHASWQVIAWEVALESVRLASAPNAASRLQCVFATEDPAAAYAFREKFRPTSSVYSVVPTEGWNGVFRGDYSLITKDVAAGAYAVVYPQVAKRYWTDPPTGSIELLIPGAVKVIGRAT